MKFSQPNADIYVAPDAPEAGAALARTTDLCVAAHQDDIEIMAYHAIAECFGRPDRWFSGVVVTNGAGSPRTGIYAALDGEQMQAVRRDEQRKAAALGDYSVCLQLAHPSAVVKDPAATLVREDLAKIFRACRPRTVYLHNPADKHDTHIAVLLRCLETLRDLPAAQRPQRVLGCEVWRNLDWLSDRHKVLLDDSARPNLAAALLGVFDSQISGGKRYDLAAVGRRLANATFFESHAVDQSTALTWAVDLTPVVNDPAASLESFVGALIDDLRTDVQKRLRAFARR